VGATNGKIINQILLDYILLQSISFLAGITISFILLKVKIFIFLPDNIDFLSVLISFIICLLIGFATVIKCLRKFLKNQAIGLRG
jgi:ABC-type antimicrobial peptide transport system permease subunit